MPVHGSHFCESGTIESEAPSPIHFMDFQHQNHWQWCQNDHPGVGDLPNEDLQAVGCPLLSRPCCGVILESIHPLRWWWGIPTSTWELSRSAYFRWQTWSPPIGSSPRPPESLEPQVEDDIKPEAWGGFWVDGGRLNAKLTAARSSEAVRTRLHFQGVSETWDSTYHWIVLFLLVNPLLL